MNMIETSSKTTVTVKLPKLLHHDMQLQIISDGYGMRGRTKWIHEAVLSLLDKPSYADLVDIASDMEDLDVAINFRCDARTTKMLDEAILHVRQQFPLMDGVKSNIIRAAICQRLLRS